MKRLVATSVLALMLAGCGAPSIGPLSGPSGQIGAHGAKQARRDAKAIEKDLAGAQKRFLAQLEASGRARQGASEAAHREMVAAMSEMAELHDELSGASRDGEAQFYAELAEIEREAVAEAKKKGLFGRLREAFWEVVNKAATKPTQHYFSKPGKPTNEPRPARFGEAELSAIDRVARPGDVILWGGPDSFVHGSLYLGNGEIVHALASNTPAGPEAQGVFRESIRKYTSRVERNRAVVMRVKHFTEADNQAAMAYVLKQVGKPYDNIFRTHDEAAFYCTELVWQALKRGKQPPAIGSRKKVMGLFNVVTTDDFRLSPDLESLWEKNLPPVIPAQ